MRLRKLTKFLRRRRSTAYYVGLILTISLAIGIGTLAITGAGLITADPELAIALHESPLVVEHNAAGSHDLTPLGMILFGREANAHGYPYCGHDTIWRTIDGVLHKIQFRWHYSNGDHRVRSAHYKYTGSGYTRISDWYYFRVDC